MSDTTETVIALDELSDRLHQEVIPMRITPAGLAVPADTTGSRVGLLISATVEHIPAADVAAWRAEVEAKRRYEQEHQR